jgi:predicted outer membrane repeat protein
MTRTPASLIAAVFCLVLAPRSLATTWHIRVDGTGDAPTIQAAVDASADGDTILVAPGTYTWTNQNSNSGYGMVYVQRGQDRLVIRSEAGSGHTVLDAQFMGRVLFIQGWNYLTLDGFTIRNGVATTTGNLVGGALTMHLSYEVIRDCVFEGNSGSAGGAVWCGGISAPRFIDCVFRYNTADWGGAIYFVNSRETPTLTRCFFHHNTAAVSGGAIQAVHNGMTIENTVFALNAAGTQGGAVYSRDAWPTRLTACTVVANTAAEGSAVYGSTLDIGLERCVVARNQQGAPYATAPGSVLAVACSDTWGNAVSDAFPAGVLDGGGNFSLDPQFCGPGAMNYLLNQVSPCLDGNHPAGAPCGPIGALGAGCGSVGAETATWGRIKALYRPRDRR